MRGRCNPQPSMPAIVDLDARIPAGHPLRTVKRLAARALAELSPVFDRTDAASGRPSIPPERLLKASLLIAPYSSRSERAFFAELEDHPLYRWVLGTDMPAPGLDASTFAKNRERRPRHAVAQRFFDEVVFRADRFGRSATRTSRWTARRSRRRLASRASAPRTAGTFLTLRRTIRATRRWTSG